LSEAWPAPFLDNTESKFGLYACGDGVHFSGDLFIISINCGSVRRFYFGRLLPILAELPAPHLSTGLIE